MLSKTLLIWYSKNKRTLPWRQSADPYKIWISEIMLQQTQVITVIPFYEKWMKSFPDIQTLANADYDTVLKHWEGLGYYSRCKNIHASAKIINNKLPKTYNELIKLPGIGDYTAKTILAIAYNQNEVGIDTNLERIGFRLLGLKKKTKINNKRVKKFLEKEQDLKSPGDFNQALMDLGSSFCKSKTTQCKPCPIRVYCKANNSTTPLDYPTSNKIKKIPTVNVSICIVIHRSKILIMKRQKGKMLEGLWEFPGGKIRAKESKKNAAIREIKEETNLTIKNPKYIGKVNHAYSHFKVDIALFYVSIKNIKGLKIKENYVWTTIKGLDKFALPKANYKMLDLLNKKAIKLC